MLAGAWLNPSTPVADGSAEGFTDQTFLNLLNLKQEASGYGPVGNWEVNFNFFNKGWIFYIKGEAALVFNSIEVDSGDFFSIVQTSSASGPSPARRTWPSSSEILGTRCGSTGLNLSSGDSVPSLRSSRRSDGFDTTSDSGMIPSSPLHSIGIVSVTSGNRIAAGPPLVARSVTSLT